MDRSREPAAVLAKLKSSYQHLIVVNRRSWWDREDQDEAARNLRAALADAHKTVTEIDKAPHPDLDRVRGDLVAYSVMAESDLADAEKSAR